MNENEPETTNPALEQGGAPSFPAPQEAKLDKPEKPLREPVDQQREDTRATVTNFLLFIFFSLLVGGAVAAYWGGDAWNNYDQFLRFALPAVTGLLGTALGFYFGSQR